MFENYLLISKITRQTLDQFWSPLVLLSFERWNGPGLGLEVPDLKVWTYFKTVRALENFSSKLASPITSSAKMIYLHENTVFTTFPINETF